MEIKKSKSNPPGSKWNELANFMSAFYRREFSGPMDLKNDPELNKIHQAAQKILKRKS
ncbi:MAG: hypothetical protein K1060chlam5_00567 [Candidatus Anoxychlamydiales bacterium]|nr:hypothetical protein [Candidatus Anoxychlamydiales bacterium]